MGCNGEKVAGDVHLIRRCEDRLIRQRCVRASVAHCDRAGVLAAVAAGWYDDARSAAAAMTSTGASFDPQPATQEFYDQLYREVYLGLYPALRASQRRLTELTRGA